MTLHSLLTAALTAACLFAPPARAAGDEHGHDHGEAAVAAHTAALPRFAAVSDTFELVGVLSGKQVTLYLDRAGDNSPVPKALIELEVAGATFKAEETAAATYTVLLANAPEPGVLPVTATVTAGNESDLLAAELDVHDTAHAETAAPPQRWKALAVGAAGLLVLVALLGLARRAAAGRAARAVRSGGTA